MLLLSSEDILPVEPVLGIEKSTTTEESEVLLVATEVVVLVILVLVLVLFSLVISGADDGDETNKVVSGVVFDGVISIVVDEFEIIKIGVEDDTDDCVFSCKWFLFLEKEEGCTSSVKILLNLFLVALDVEEEASSSSPSNDDDEEEEDEEDEDEESSIEISNLQSGQVLWEISQGSIHSTWNSWPQGITLSKVPSSKVSKQTAQVSPSSSATTTSFPSFFSPTFCSPCSLLIVASVADEDEEEEADEDEESDEVEGVNVVEGERLA